MMHKSFVLTETGIKNRTGQMYRNFADGKMSKFELKIGLSLVVDDIIEICMNRQAPCGNDAKIICGIREHFFDKGALHDRNMMFCMLAAVFAYGFMQGGKAVRNKEDAKLQKLNRGNRHGKTT